MYEERMHIRNIKTGKVYLADMGGTTPADMAVKAHYVGLWHDGCLDLSAMYESDEEA